MICVTVVLNFAYIFLTILSNLLILHTFINLPFLHYYDKSGLFYNRKTEANRMNFTKIFIFYKKYIMFPNTPMTIFLSTNFNFRTQKKAPFSRGFFLSFQIRNYKPMALLILWMIWFILSLLSGVIILLHSSLRVFNSSSDVWAK